MHRLTKHEILDLQPSDEIFHVKIYRLEPEGRFLVREGKTELHIHSSARDFYSPCLLTAITPALAEWINGSHHDVVEREGQGSLIVDDNEVEIYSKGERVVLTSEEKAKFEQWIVQNIGNVDIPAPDCFDLLAYNLVHLLRGDSETYTGRDEQDDEIENWYGETWEWQLEGMSDEEEADYCDGQYPAGAKPLRLPERFYHFRPL